MDNKRKHREHNLNDFYVGKLHKEKYGFIEIDNPEFYKKDIGYDYVGLEFLMRKPTPKERKDIIINYVIVHNGEGIDMSALADDLCISKRLIQMILKSLREEGVIEIVHTFDENGKQLINKYRYVGTSRERCGSSLTLDMLYDTENKA